ncbi:acyl-CoA reductase [Pedobacter sp. HMF7056]|uniref:Acyl-CoA reductase n=1 Tax=Hufsiella ginkgonis TaxID=2695274 RepID=A0A7K1XVY0_9SPHI|nr:acyl-CoA reductase [Hufsiella ginkgonis]
MTYSQRIEAFARWGEFMRSDDERLQAFVLSAQYDNAWFTPEETGRALRAIASMLEKEQLEEWFLRDFPPGEGSDLPAPKKVGLILAGNIPLVGFHDVLSVLAFGYKALIKLSSNDKRLLPFLLEKLVGIEPAFSGSFVFIDRLVDFDAVIATGSGNTSRYFDYYFSKVPNIIRKNRTSVAVLDGTESPAQLFALGHDVFDYFGLGCRNVSKIYVPAGYDLAAFFLPVEPFNTIGDHHKYHNNYEYNKSIMLVNGDKHFDNGFLLVRESPALNSPLAVIHYEEYDHADGLVQKLGGIAGELQVIVTSLPLSLPVQTVTFGESQQPRLWDYADGRNIIEFLRQLLPVMNDG